MPRILHTETRADAIVDAVSHLIVTRGVDTLSLRSIAAATGLSPSTLLHQLTNRTRLLRVCASRFVRRHMAELGYRVQLESAHGFLPRTPEEIRDMRVWLGWRELGRRNSMPFPRSEPPLRSSSSWTACCPIVTGPRPGRRRRAVRSAHEADAAPRDRTGGHHARGLFRRGRR